MNFYSLRSVEKLQSQLEKEHAHGEALRKRIIALRRGKGPVMATQHQHYLSGAGRTKAEQIERPF